MFQVMSVMYIFLVLGDSYIIEFTFLTEYCFKFKDSLT